MKTKYKTSNRERWIAALAPAFAIGAIYYYGYEGSLASGLQAANKRLTAAQAPLAPVGPSPELARAKTSLEDTKRAITAEQANVQELSARLATLSSMAANPAGSENAADVIGRVEAVFVHNGITPLVSESINNNTVARVPERLLTALSPKLDAGGGSHARVWHYVFDDLTFHFKQALADLAHDVPGVVPLSMNFVYNPNNGGETRELELWVLY